MRYLFNLIFFLLSSVLIAQEKLHSNDSLKCHAMIRFYYQNDVFTNTDYYFTQGEQTEFIHPALDHFFLRKILVGQHLHSYTHTGIASHGGGYTPKLLDTMGILIGDRPFAAYLYFGYFLETASPEKDLFIRTEFALGWIGPEAFGKPTQEYIHKHTGNIKPLGWNNEIHTDIIIQYGIEADKLLLSVYKVPLLWWEGKMNAGTLRDNISLGFKMNGEPLENVFGKSQRKLFFSPYAGIYYALIGYDALMQGGVFNHSSPYVIRSSQVERLVIKSNAGVKVRFKKLQINLCIEWISPEFKGGSSHSWGNVQVLIFL